MKLEILLIALICTVKATGKVNGDLLKIEEGGSGTENDTLINSIKRINGGSKKQIDTDTEASGIDELDTDSSSDIDGYISGSGEYGSGSGDPDPPLKVISTSSPTFEISTGVKNATSQTVVVINPGGTVAAVTTTHKETVTTTHKETVTDKKHTKEISEPNNSVEDPRISSEDENTNKIDSEKSTGLDEGDNDSGINFTIAIVVGVVVGAILSILIIVFLVYRLRKKDEGSYSLDEPSSAMLTADTDSPPPKGKGEYYA